MAGARPSQPGGFYRFQRLAGSALLGWGAANVAAGAAGLALANPVLRQVGLQALVWGAIDALIALAGRRAAARQEAQGADSQTQARRFRTIVLANAALDVGYVAAGLALIRRAAARPERAGMGLGMLLQGLFLLLFDSALALLAGRYTRA